MNSEEFVQTCSSMGYSSKKLAKKYVEKNQKDAYDMDDIINVHRKSGNFKGNHKSVIGTSKRSWRKNWIR